MYLARKRKRSALLATHDNAGRRRISRKLSDGVVESRVRNILKVAEAYRRGLVVLDRRGCAGYAGIDAFSLKCVRDDKAPQSCSRPNPGTQRTGFPKSPRLM
jgi:hypothetical protein